MNTKIINAKFSVLLLFILIFGANNIVSAQNKDLKTACIAFYNLENLFDTIDTEGVKDTEFTIKGSKAWTGKRFWRKVNNMSKVISQIGDEFMKGGPVIMGVSEIENRTVLESLLKTDYLKNSGYKIVHYDSPDRRGIDVGLMYRSDYFTVTNSLSVNFMVPDSINPYNDEFRSRSQLVVSGLLNGEKIHIIVNHWPSRRGGKRSGPLRDAAADLCRHSADSILSINPNAKIFIMGDLNDDPVDPSVIKHLRAKKRLKDMKKGDFYNPYALRYNRGIGTTAYRDAWSLFDQIIVTTAVLSRKIGTYHFKKAKIFRKKFLLQKTGKYEGYPKRTFSFDKFQNGYSDHFPVYVVLKK